jgi:transposase
MAHARRRFFDLCKAVKSPLAREALDRIAKLYQIEDRIHGLSPEERCERVQGSSRGAIIRAARQLPCL